MIVPRPSVNGRVTGQPGDADPRRVGAPPSGHFRRPSDTSRPLRPAANSVTNAAFQTNSIGEKLERARPESQPSSFESGPTLFSEVQVRFVGLALK